MFDNMPFWHDYTHALAQRRMRVFLEFEQVRHEQYVDAI